MLCVRLDVDVLATIEVDVGVTFRGEICIPRWAKDPTMHVPRHNLLSGVGGYELLQRLAEFGRPHGCTLNDVCFEGEFSPLAYWRVIPYQRPIH